MPTRRAAQAARDAAPHEAAVIIEETDIRAPGAHRPLEQRLMWITRQRVF